MRPRIAGSAAKRAAPNPIGEHGGIRFAGRYAAAHEKRDVQGAEEIVRHRSRIKPAGAIAVPPVHFALEIDSRGSRKHVRVPQKLKIGKRRGAVSALPYGDQRGAIAAGRLAEQKAGGDIEDRGVRADSQRQAANGGRGEARIAAEGAGGVAQIGGQVLEPPDLPGAGRVFGRLQARAEFAARPAQRFGARHAGALQFLGPALDMELHFVGELGLKTRPAGQPAQAASKVLAEMPWRPFLKLSSSPVGWRSPAC